MQKRGEVSRRPEAAGNGRMRRGTKADGYCRIRKGSRGTEAVGYCRMRRGSRGTEAVGYCRI